HGLQSGTHGPAEEVADMPDELPQLRRRSGSTREEEGPPRYGELSPGVTAGQIPGSAARGPRMARAEAGEPIRGWSTTPVAAVTYCLPAAIDASKQHDERDTIAAADSGLCCRTINLGCNTNTNANAMAMTTTVAVATASAALEDGGSCGGGAEPREATDQVLEEAGMSGRMVSAEPSFPAAAMTMGMTTMTSTALETLQLCGGEMKGTETEAAKVDLPATEIPNISKVNAEALITQTTGMATAEQPVASNKEVRDSDSSPLPGGAVEGSGRAQASAAAMAVAAAAAVTAVFAPPPFYPLVIVLREAPEPSEQNDPDLDPDPIQSCGTVPAVPVAALAAGPGEATPVKRMGSYPRSAVLLEDEVEAGVAFHVHQGEDTAGTTCANDVGPAALTLHDSGRPTKRAR
ncbi:hypothetical protein Vafri_15541, partial [Volvox africanus]